MRIASWFATAVFLACATAEPAFGYFLSNGSVQVDVTKSGASIGLLRYKGTNFTLRKGRLFSDRYFRHRDKVHCEYEDSSGWVWKECGREQLTNGVCCCYSTELKMFDLTVEKCYFLPVDRNSLVVTWTFRNHAEVPRHVGLYTTLPMMVEGGPNAVAVPRGGNVERWNYPERKNPLEIADTPSQRWSAMWERTGGRGVIVKWPEHRTSGVFNWMVPDQETVTLECFGVDEAVPEGGVCSYSTVLDFTDDVPRAIESIDCPTGELVGEPSMWIKRFTDSARFRHCTVKARRLDGVKVSAKEAEQELNRDFRIPTSFLTSVHTNTVTWHEDWFKPSAPCGIFFMYAPDWVLLGNGQRFLVELLQRCDLDFRVLPLLNTVFGVKGHGEYSVQDTDFGTDFSDWTMALLREVKDPPKATVIVGTDFAGKQQEAVDILTEWQMQGTRYVFVDCANIPIALRDAKSGNRIVSSLDWKNPFWPTVDNSGRPEERRMANYAGREFPHFDYFYLDVLRTIRQMCGSSYAASIRYGNLHEIVVDANCPGTYQMEIKVKDAMRFVDRVERRRMNLAMGENRIPFDVTVADGDRMVDLRLINPEGLISDATAFHVKMPQRVKITTEFSNTNRIFSAEERIAFSVATDGLKHGMDLETFVEDGDGRVVYRTDARSAWLQLPEPKARIYRIVTEVRDGGGICARHVDEFSVRSGPLDLKDTHAYITVHPPSTEYCGYLRDLGFDFVIAPFGADIERAIVAECAYLGIQAVPRNCAEDRSWFNPYRHDASPHGVIRKPCFSSPAFKEALEERIERVAKSVGYDYYNVRLHWLSDESFLGAEVCQSPWCLAGFRAELKRRYASIDALNAEWGSGFRSFDEVVPSRLSELTSKDNLAPWLEHKMFMAGVLADKWLGCASETLRRCVPNCFSGPTGTQVPGYGYDWTRLMRHIDATGYYFGTQRKYVHDFAELYGRGVLAGQCGGGYTRGDVDYEPYNYDVMWSGLLKGSNLAYHYFGAAIYGDVASTSNMMYWTKSMNELKSGIGKLFLSAKTDCGIYVLYSQASVFAAIGTGREDSWQNSQTSWWRLLSEGKYEHRFYPSCLLEEKGVPSAAKVLVLPYALALSDREIQVIADFIRRGGRVFADVTPAERNQSGRLRKTPCELEDVVCFGPELCTYNSVVGCGEGETSRARSAAGEVARRLRVRLADECRKSGVESLCRVIGKNGLAYPCDAALRYDGVNAVFAMHVDTAGADNDRTSADGGTARGRFDLGKGDAVTAVLPLQGHVYDVREGVYIGYTNRIETTMIPGWTRLYSIMRDAPIDLTVAGPKFVRAGDCVAVDFSADGATGPQVFHIEVRDPSGKSAWRFRQNMRIEGNRGSFSYASALNDMSGLWKIEVTHVNTGRKRVHEFEMSLQ